MNCFLHPIYPLAEKVPSPARLINIRTLFMKCSQIERRWVGVDSLRLSRAFSQLACIRERGEIVATCKEHYCVSQIRHSLTFPLASLYQWAQNNCSFHYRTVHLWRLFLYGHTVCLGVTVRLRNMHFTLGARYHLLPSCEAWPLRKPPIVFERFRGQNRKLKEARPAIESMLTFSTISVFSVLS